MNNPEHLEHLRHSAAHLLAAAVLELYPDAKLTLGPAIESGFYYDIDFNDVTLSVEDLPAIEKKMKDLVNDWKEFTHREVSPEEAKEIYKGNAYKLEMIHDIAEKGEKITLYTCGNFTDLCRGGHVEEPRKMLRAFKLMSIAGAYWRGDEKNAMLTRIYGTAFETKEELKAHVDMLEEAKKRDHRKLGKELGLFVFSDLVGPGMPMYTPKGNIVRNAIVNFSRELNARVGFGEVHTPNMNKADLFRTSGHYDKYKDDMLQVVSHYTDEEYYLKPMNCPQHTQIYASEMRSYRDLPIRFADFANLYRDEKPGELSGLTRLRCFSQDDGHSFCREDQIESEFKNILNIINTALKTYGLDYFIRLSLWDPEHKEKYLGDEKIWDKSQKLLEKLLDENKVNYETALGEAAFYGPKMDIIAKDALKRQWQISTIQLDFNMPLRFKLSYTDKDGSEKTPVMIHRAIIGSPERFMGILIEHYGGAFPLWLAPVQVKIISVGEAHIEFCQKMAAEFSQENIKVELDISDETVGNKIRKSSQEKIPYTLVIGDKEMSSENLSVRVRNKQELLNISKDQFIKQLKEDISKRSSNLL